MSAEKGTRWTEELTEELKTRRAAGESYTQISAAMSNETCAVTRNMLVGRMWRLGLCKEFVGRPRQLKPGPDHPFRRVRTPRNRRKTSDQPATSAGQWSSDIKHLTAPQPLSREVHVAPGMKCEGIKIEDLNDGDCRFPLWADNREPWDLESVKYCGLKALKGLPYCAYHARRAYAGTTKVNTWLCPQS